MLVVYVMWRWENMLHSEFSPNDVVDAMLQSNIYTIGGNLDLKDNFHQWRKEKVEYLIVDDQDHVQMNVISLESEEIVGVDG